MSAVSRLSVHCLNSPCTVQLTSSIQRSASWTPGVRRRRHSSTMCRLQGGQVSLDSFSPEVLSSLLGVPEQMGTPNLLGESQVRSPQLGSRISCDPPSHAGCREMVERGVECKATFMEGVRTYREAVGPPHHWLARRQGRHTGITMLARTYINFGILIHTPVFLTPKIP